jgi:Putative zinc-finger
VTCAEARLQLSVWLDGELEPRVVADLEDHLAGCAMCRAFEHVVRSEQAALIELWPAVAVPSGFAERVRASLPPRVRRPISLTKFRRLAWVAAALLVIAVGGGVLAQPAAWASFGLFLRHVVLHETTSTDPQRLLPTGHLTIDQAQTLVPWHILQPSELPDGYRLVAVEADELHAFAIGPTIVLHYQPADGDASGELSLVELQTTSEVSEPVAPGAVRQVPVGGDGHTGLLIDGRWAERDNQQVWEPGTLLRLIVESGNIVVQLQVDPRAGWDAAQLARVAASLSSDVSNGASAVSTANRGIGCCEPI